MTPAKGADERESTYVKEKFGQAGLDALNAVGLLADLMDACPDCGGFASGHDCETCLAIDAVRALLRRKFLKGYYAELSPLEQAHFLRAIPDNIVVLSDDQKEEGTR